MRKNLLALSIAAMVGGLSGAANAAVITAGTTATVLEPTTTGVGHILTVPYFSTQGNNKTLLNIVNTDTVNGKAVKLRFRGAANSDDVFDITVYLSPGDVWTADVAADAEGFSRLVTTDTSCTLPSAQDIKDANNGRFKTHRVQGGAAAQTREGYVEILNTADIAPGTGAAGANSALYTAIKHVAGKAPCTQAIMDLQENDLNTIPADHNSAAVRGYTNPTGSLMANWVLVNVAGFASHSGEAVAVRANLVAGGASAPANIVWFPQTTATPTAGAVTSLTSDPLLQSAGFASQVANYDFPDLSTPYTAPAVVGAPETQADLLANALGTTSVTNEYLTGNGFSTDWVFSMPTRRYAVALNYAAPAATRLMFSQDPDAGGPLLANNRHFTAANTSLNADGSLACVTPGSMRGYDREENTQSTFVISPDVALRLCGETTVLAFNNTGESVLGGAIARTNIKTKFNEGWFTINTAARAGGAATGLPIIGFSASKVTGANLGGTWKHRTAR